MFNKIIIFNTSHYLYFIEKRRFLFFYFFNQQSRKENKPPKQTLENQSKWTIIMLYQNPDMHGCVNYMFAFKNTSPSAVPHHHPHPSPTPFPIPPAAEKIDKA